MVRVHDRPSPPLAVGSAAASVETVTDAVPNELIAALVAAILRRRVARELARIDAALA